MKEHGCTRDHIRDNNRVVAIITVKDKQYSLKNQVVGATASEWLEAP